MGFYYRKSFSAGPFRVNLGRSGVGYSIGGRNFRTGVSSRGRRYSSVSIPGTGLGYRTSGRSGCAVVLIGAVGLLAATAAAFREVLS